MALRKSLLCFLVRKYIEKKNTWICALEKIYIYIYIFGKRHIATFHKKNPNKNIFKLYVGEHIAKYVATSNDVDSKTQKLIANLDSESKQYTLRLISRLVSSYTAHKKIITNLTPHEIETQKRIYSDFYPNIFKISENLYSYNGLLFPCDFLEISVLFHKNNIPALHPKTLEKIKNMDFIDAGACIGDSALVMQEFTNAKIYCFEPTSKNFALLNKTIELNNSKQIVPVNKGLGSKSEVLNIAYNTQNIGGSVITPATQGNDMDENVEIITLDDFVREHNIKVGLIKVDVEGFEQELLKGAMETIKTQRPAMILSIYHNADDFFNIKPMIESWNLGYSFKITKGVDFTLDGEIVLLCEIL